MLLILLSLATWRVTRFAISDNLIHGFRLWLHYRILGDGKRAWRAKLHELITCWWCLSVWVAAGVVAVVDQFTIVPLPWLMWLAVAGGAMAVHGLVE